MLLPNDNLVIAHLFGCLFHSRSANTHINRIHEIALRNVYNDYVSTTFVELLQKHNTLGIHHRNNQILALEIFKIRHNICPQIMKDIFTGREIKYNLRKDAGFKIKMDPQLDMKRIQLFSWTKYMEFITRLHERNTKLGNF